MSEIDDLDFDEVIQDSTDYIDVEDGDSSELRKQLYNLMSQGTSGMSIDDISNNELEVMKIPEESVPKIKNVIACVNTKCQIPLKLIACRVKNTEYNPKRFSAVTMRIRNPKASANIFSNGKIVITGARDETLCRKAAIKFVKIVRKAGVTNAGFYDYKIHNVMAHSSLGFPVKLEGLATKFDTLCSYQPELFPGLVWRFTKPKANAIIFVSGEITFTGSKSREDIYKCFEMMYPKLLSFMKKSHTARITTWIKQSQGKTVDGGTEEKPIEIE